MRVLNAVLRRRMLTSYLAVCLTLYALAIATALGHPDAWSEWISVGVCGTGLLACAPRPLCGWRYLAALFCAGAAPVTALLGHREPAAQVWTLIPLILIAMFIRSWHRPRTARIAALALAAAAVTGLVVAPAPVPPLWLVLFPVCIVGATEVIGLLHAALLDAALRDPLTTVWNRTGLNRELDELLPRARRRGEDLAVIVLDIDDFKSVNDRDGHAAGDTVLAQLTRRWLTQVPDSALIGRLGGDEFVAVLAGYDTAGAHELARTLRGEGPVHVSTGIAVGPAYGPAAFAKLLAEADRDLYLAKSTKTRPPEAPAL